MSTAPPGRTTQPGRRHAGRASFRMSGKPQKPSLHAATAREFVWHRGAPALEKRQYTGTPVHRAGILDRSRRLWNEVVRAFLNIVNILLTMGIEHSQGLSNA